MKHHHLDQGGAQGKGISLIVFPCIGHNVVVGRLGYRIDGHTIKREFWLINLTILS
jgi:hypothetical protein